MTAIIPFDSGSSKLPAYLSKPAFANLNADLLAHKGGGYPVLSIKGKRFTVVRGDERVVLMNPKDPDSPATNVDLVLIKVNKNPSKTFYLKGYDPETSEGQKPDCYSPDGVSPALDSPAMQSAKCATCRHNQWGSRVSGDRAKGKGKACADSVRIAVAPAGQLNDPMLLRVPPASIKNLGEYGSLLDKRGVPYSVVVTKVGFDSDAESPVLTFKPVGLLDEQGAAEVVQVMEDSVVQNILQTGAGTAPFIPEVAPAGVPAAQADPQPEPQVSTSVETAKAVTADEVRSAVSKAAKKTVAAPAPAPAADDLEIELDGISFDD